MVRNINDNNGAADLPTLTFINGNRFRVYPHYSEALAVFRILGLAILQDPRYVGSYAMQEIPLGIENWNADVAKAFQVFNTGRQSVQIVWIQRFTDGKLEEGKGNQVGKEGVGSGGGGPKGKGKGKSKRVSWKERGVDLMGSFGGVFGMAGSEEVILICCLVLSYGFLNLLWPFWSHWTPYLLPMVATLIKY
ncbi:hypothetical protein K458DRAFT_398884 [Lentithecium fluviatile CBS 122367]|uniref:Uncharacterized protein n=1 Tax=Lentithecium fluviatile CBS 122367 TaxID=1168545 RepID=A0A6G1JLA7_9PLEO|nr:hypothetical protein K458DRAFT_398884 [Lentithecium fluviatile CBS 122367]